MRRARLLTLAALAAAAGCSAPARSAPQNPAGAPPPCPVSQAAPAVFPAAVGSWRQAGPPGDRTQSTDEITSAGGHACALPAVQAEYQSQPGSFVTLKAGRHGASWTSFAAFWGRALRHDGPVTFVPAGPYGGQAGCVTPGRDEAVCVWFTTTSFGEFDSPGPEAQAASLMLIFRAAVKL